MKSKKELELVEMYENKNSSANELRQKLYSFFLAKDSVKLYLPNSILNYFVEFCNYVNLRIDLISMLYKIKIQHRLSVDQKFLDIMEINIQGLQNDFYFMMFDSFVKLYCKLKRNSQTITSELRLCIDNLNKTLEKSSDSLKNSIRFDNCNEKYKEMVLRLLLYINITKQIAQIVASDTVGDGFFCLLQKQFCDHKNGTPNKFAEHSKGFRWEAVLFNTILFLSELKNKSSKQQQKKITVALIKGVLTFLQTASKQFVQKKLDEICSVIDDIYNEYCAISLLKETNDLVEMLKKGIKEVLDNHSELLNVEQRSILHAKYANVLCAVGVGYLEEHTKKSALKKGLGKLSFYFIKQAALYVEEKVKEEKLLFIDVSLYIFLKEAELYEDGIGIKRDLEQAAYCYEKIIGYYEKTKSSITDCNKQIVSLAKNNLGYMYKAHEIERQDHFLKAEKLFEEACEVDPNCENVNPRINLAYLYFEQGEKDKAIYSLLALWETSCDAYLINLIKYNVGLMYYYDSKNDLALAYFSLISGKTDCYLAAKILKTIIEISQGTTTLAEEIFPQIVNDRIMCAEEFVKTYELLCKLYFSNIYIRKLQQIISSLDEDQDNKLTEKELLEYRKKANLYLDRAKKCLDRISSQEQYYSELKRLFDEAKLAIENKIKTKIDLLKPSASITQKRLTDSGLTLKPSASITQKRLTDSSLTLKPDDNRKKKKVATDNSVVQDKQYKDFSFNLGRVYSAIENKHLTFKYKIILMVEFFNNVNRYTAFNRKSYLSSIDFCLEYIAENFKRCKDAQLSLLQENITNIRVLLREVSNMLNANGDLFSLFLLTRLVKHLACLKLNKEEYFIKILNQVFKMLDNLISSEEASHNKLNSLLCILGVIAGKINLTSINEYAKTITIKIGNYLLRNKDEYLIPQKTNLLFILARLSAAYSFKFDENLLKTLVEELYLFFKEIDQQIVNKKINSDSDEYDVIFFNKGHMAIKYFKNYFNLEHICLSALSNMRRAIVDSTKCITSESKFQREVIDCIKSIYNGKIATISEEFFEAEGTIPVDAKITLEGISVKLMIQVDGIPHSLFDIEADPVRQVVSVKDSGTIMSKYFLIDQLLLSDKSNKVVSFSYHEWTKLEHSTRDGRRALITGKIDGCSTKRLLCAS